MSRPLVSIAVRRPLSTGRSVDLRRVVHLLGGLDEPLDHVEETSLAVRTEFIRPTICPTGDPSSSAPAPVARLAPSFRMEFE